VVGAEEKIHEGALRGAGLRRGLAWHVEILTGLAGGGEGVGMLDVGQDELKGGDRRERGGKETLGRKRGRDIRPVMGKERGVTPRNGGIWGITNCSSPPL
jgi:hypothetical protein